MRTAITALLATVAGIAAPALAQPDQQRQDRREYRQDRGDIAQPRGDDRRNDNYGSRDGRGPASDGVDRRGDRPDFRPGGQGAQPGYAEQRDVRRNDNPGAQPGFADQRDDRRDWQGRGDDHRDGRPGLRGQDDRRDGRFDGRPGFNGRPGFANRPGFDNRSAGNDRGGAWNNGWRNDGRYDWQRYRSGNRSFYTLPRYYAPSGFGYGYRRFGLNTRLGASFYGNRYWINDPYAYRLPPAYGSYRWVRYYNDVLLVDVANGLIRDALYGFFY